MLIASSIGLFFYFRSRRNRRLRGLPISRQDAEESIALTRSDGNGHGDDGDELRRRDKGKGRQLKDDEASKEAIFDVGDSDGDEEESDDDDDDGGGGYKDQR